ncbi:MAG: B12-binding domain-containing protein, partial [Planctomycetota bacterium]
MDEQLAQLATCVERGKVNKAAPYPADMKGREGADELTRKALDAGIPPHDVLDKALVIAMQRIGEKFRKNEVFLPEVIMAAKAMKAGMEHLTPLFQSAEVKRRGTLVIGTVAGDLHDIGKNVVAMIVEGGGWEVIDLGVDVTKEKF